MTSSLRKAGTRSPMCFYFVKLSSENVEHPLTEWQCHICDKILKVSSKKSHLASHEEPQLECDICGKMFRQKQGLEAHLNVHKEIRDFHCIPCNRVSFNFWFSG